MSTPGTRRRRPTCRMYPSPAREQKLPWMKGAHGDPHNGLLEQRIARHRRSGEGPSRYDRAGAKTITEAGRRREGARGGPASETSSPTRQVRYVGWLFHPRLRQRLGFTTTE